MKMSISSEKRSIALHSRLAYYMTTLSMFLLVMSLVFLLGFDRIRVEREPLVTFPTPKQIVHTTNTPVISHRSSRTFHTTTKGIHKSRPNVHTPVISQYVPSRAFVPTKDVPKFCNKSNALLRVYMYDLPPKFHFGMLGWTGDGHETWPRLNSSAKIPRYPGAMNAQHSLEYWITLDLLASDYPGSIARPCSAMRVHNSSEADAIFVPFFSSLSYNRDSKRRGKEKHTGEDKALQLELLEFLQTREEWRRRRGRDHLFVAHHPNSLYFVRKMLKTSVFLLADFGRLPKNVAYLEKDVVAPYMHLVKTDPVAIDLPFHQRPNLIYFQGGIARKAGGTIRKKIYPLLKDKKGIHFKYGSFRSHGVEMVAKGMATSKFCLNIAGDTPSSNRLFDAIASHCIPVIISDDIELPYEDIIDYSKFSIFVRAENAIKKGYLIDLLQDIKKEKWTEMLEYLKEVSKHFEYQFPSRPNDAVDMIWQSLTRGRSLTLLNIHRKRRFDKSCPCG